MIYFKNQHQKNNYDFMMQSLLCEILQFVLERRRYYSKHFKSAVETGKLNAGDIVH